MRRDLANARMGQFVGADGRTFSLRAPRIEQAEIEELIEAGCPVVTYLVGGRLLWHDEDDAWPAWADARSAPDTVTAGRWESPDGGTAVVLVPAPGDVGASAAGGRHLAAVSSGRTTVWWRGRGRTRRGGR